MNPRRLYRCTHDRKIAGVAAGIAEHFDLDPTVVRIAWIVSVFFGGFTILLYVILAFVIPVEPAWAPPAGVATAAGEGPADGAATEPGAGPAMALPVADVAAPAHGHRARGRDPGRATFVLGVLLVIFGSIALAGPLLPGWVTGATLGPAFILALGIALVVGATRRSAPEG